MNYLLDVNVLVAWGWSDHMDHRRAAAWIGAMMHRKNTLLFTSAIPELGFVRVSVQRTGGRMAVRDVVETLEGMLGTLGKRHKFLTDDQSSVEAWPEWCHSASKTTDAHLLRLASRHKIRLATLDEGIPGGFLIPLAPSTL